MQQTMERVRRVKTRPLPKKQKKQLSFKLVKSALKKQIETEMLLENMLDFLTESLKNLKNTLMSDVTLRNGIFLFTAVTF